MAFAAVVPSSVRLSSSVPDQVARSFPSFAALISLAVSSLISRVLVYFEFLDDAAIQYSLGISDCTSICNARYALRMECTLGGNMRDGEAIL